MYGSLGATATLIFFIYLLGILVVSSPILNHSLYEELRAKREQAAVRGDGLAGGFTRMKPEG